MFTRSPRTSGIPGLWALLGLCFALGGGLRAQDVELTASVSQNPVYMNQQFTYSLEISGSTSGLPDINLPPMPDFRVLSGPNQSSNYQILNGKVSSKLTYSVVLLPRSEGKFTIPAVSVVYKGKTYRSNAIELNVTRQPASQSGGEAAPDDKVFLRIIPSKRSVYINEPIDVSVRLYFRVTVRSPDFIKLPETVGFWVEEYEMPQNIPVTNEMLNGVQYQVAEIRKMALFPTRSGKLTISESQLAVNVVERRRNRDPFGMMDDFFSDPLGRSVRQVLASRPVTINVKPLPEEGKPADFSGLVGSYRLSTDIDKSDVQTNEAFSISVRLSGNGNLKVLDDLKVDFPPGFEVYDPKVKDNVRRSVNSRFSATRELEYVLIPRVVGEFPVGPINLSYFDPSSARYKTLSSPQYKVIVTPGDESVSGLSGNFVAKSDVQVLGRDINFIKETGLQLVKSGALPYQGWWFWAGLGLPLLAFAGAFAYRRHREQMSGDIGYARNRTARRTAHKRLKGAENHLKSGAFSEFYGEMSRGLIGFLGDKTNRETTGMTRLEIEALLADYDVNDDLRQDFLTCLDEADFRRFAPADNQAEQARDFFERGSAVLDQLSKRI